MFTPILSTIAPNWKQSKYPSTDKEMIKTTTMTTRHCGTSVQQSGSQQEEGTNIETRNRDESQMCMESERSQTQRLPTLWFHVYDILDKVKV